MILYLDSFIVLDIYVNIYVECLISTSMAKSQGKRLEVAVEEKSGSSLSVSACDYHCADAIQL